MSALLDSPERDRRMKISIVTVCYNAAAVIDGCLTSVAEQTYRNFEHIVIDGLSDDATVAIVQRYPHVTTCISERDQGIYDAMNKGLDRVTGDYVLFLNADDALESPTTLAKAVTAIGGDPGADVYYGWLEVRPLDGPPQVFRPPPPSEAPEFMVCGCLPHQSTLARPSVFARTGRFDLRYRCHADYDWFLKVLADPGIDVRSISEVIGSFRLGGASSQLAEGQPEVYRIQNQSPLYEMPEWDRKRIVALQEAFLRERLETARLRDALRSAGEQTRILESADVKVDRGYRTPIARRWRSLPGAGRAALGQMRSLAVSRRQRLRWWLLETLVRLLPDRAVGILRRLRKYRRAMRTRRRVSGLILQEPPSALEWPKPATNDEDYSAEIPKAHPRNWTADREKEAAGAVAQDPADYKLYHQARAASLGDLTGKTVLVVGCNRGEDCKYFLDIGARLVVGLDILEEIGQGFVNDAVSYIRASAEEMPLKSGAFDLVFAYATLEHVPDIRRTFREMVRATAFSGCIYSAAAPLWCARSGPHWGAAFDHSPWPHLRLSVDEVVALGQKARQAGSTDPYYSADLIRQHLTDPYLFNRRRAHEYVDACSSLGGIRILRNDVEFEEMTAIDADVVEKLLDSGYTTFDLFGLTHMFVATRLPTSGSALG